MLSEEPRSHIEIENKKITETIHKIKKRIVIFSGKGGVGKTTASINIAVFSYQYHVVEPNILLSCFYLFL